MLDFEAEESAILEATARLPVQLNVEESGCGEFLKDRLAQDDPVEAVHISCHGTILKDDGPMLAFETPAGDLDPISPGDFADVLGEKKALLVFLSACRTAETEAIEPYVRQLIRTGVPNVLGWDGSVYDSDAIHFARNFYNELAEHATVPFAAAKARREVLKAHRNDPNKGLHWHLARVYAGPDGAGPCCDRAKEKRKLRKEAGYKEFLDKANNRVPVATAREFVGRRRQAQAVLRAFRNGGQTGVLLFGMGNLGKSSLAARIANRLPKHQTVVVYERYDALAVFDQLVAALPGGDRAKWEQNWRDSIKNNGAALGNALEDMLEGPFDEKPILLIIDDLEQILEDPKPDQKITPVKDAPGTSDAWRGSLASVLRAFKAADTESRLLLTSRFDFTLPDGKGGDLAAKLERVQLRPMESNERAKQWRAAKRIAGQAEEKLGDGKKSLVKRALAVAGGNPGLQEILCRPILAGEIEAAGDALDAVDRWKASSEVPTEENAAQEFFNRVAFETYRNALTESQRTQLRAATLFSEGLPIPMSALEAVGQALGAADPKACLIRLIGLGLVDNWGDILGVEHAAANPLARPLVGEKLTEEEKKLLATAAMIPLAEDWRDGDGDFPTDPKGVEIARLALIGDAPMDILDAAALAAGIFLFERTHNAKGALTVLNAFLMKLEKLGGSPQPQLLLIASNCAFRIGETELRIALLEKGLELQSTDKVSIAQIKAIHAEATITLNGVEKTLDTLTEIAVFFKDIGAMRSWAVTRGKIADILNQDGNAEEALRIHSQETLPVYELLDDLMSKAATLGKIADIHQQRTNLDEALRIHRDEELPIYDILDATPARAITMSRIAGIYKQQGKIDEALCIFIQDCLPVAKSTYDLEGIAHIRFSCAKLRLLRGGLDKGEAQTIVNELEESFALNIKLQNLSEVAAVGSLLGQILLKAGQVEKSLIFFDAAAAAFDKIGMAEKADEVREIQKQIRAEKV